MIRNFIRWAQGQSRFWLWTVWLLFSCFLTGCESFHGGRGTAPPVIQGPAREGQAVWRPQAGALELAGELLLVSDGQGAFLVQFSKSPLTLVTAWRNTNGWHIEFPPQQRSISGRGEPPDRFCWFQLGSALSGLPVTGDWRFEPGTNWRLDNPRTGEFLEGYLSP